MIKHVLILAVLFLIPQPGMAAIDTVEGLHREVSARLAAFEEELSLRERRTMNRVSWKERMSLSPGLRDKYQQWHQLLEQEEKWRKGIELKQELLALHDKAMASRQEVQAEADRISREVLEIMYRYRKEWKMLNMALFQNMLINMKLKDKGFCWHWVEKFVGTLRPIGFKHFDFHWGVAYEGKLRENNALVIVSLGSPFETGLAIDAWRSSGRPFWRLVKKDRFPWVKRDESQIEIGEYDEEADVSAKQQ